MSQYAHCPPSKSQSKLSSWPVLKQEFTFSRNEIDTVFCIDHIIGKGGFSRCYSVNVKNATVNPMMVKCMRKDKIVSERQRQLCRREMDMLKIVSHTNIVTLVDCFETQAFLFILSEYCIHGNLMDMMKYMKRLDVNDARYIILHMTRGIAYLHQNRIVHRDIKPANVVVGENCVPKLCDFGLSLQLTDDKERRRTLCGTPNYMAPEMLINIVGHGCLVDMWALGCCLYFFVMGYAPFETDSIKSTFARIKTGVYSIPSFMCKHPDACDFMHRVLTVSPCLRLTAKAALKQPFLTVKTVVPWHLFQREEFRKPSAVFPSMKSNTPQHRTLQSIQKVKTVRKEKPKSTPRKGIEHVPEILMNMSAKAELTSVPVSSSGATTSTECNNTHSSMNCTERIGNMFITSI